MKVTKLFKEFFESEKAGGLILIACTLLSLILSNSGIGAAYLHLWHINIGGMSLEHIVNEGLMTIFFLLIGLELERELYVGELSDWKNALLPVIGAIGGILVPATIYLAINFGSTTQSGAGIPMATDIAFALGILSLLGKRVPLSLKIFLTALAVIDDLGAILIIALFYTKTLFWLNLLIAAGIFIVLLLLKRFRVSNLLPYIVGGIGMWYCMLHSGVHATITGILLAFAIPFKNEKKKSASYLLQHFLHKPVAFIILPLFALANTAIVFNTGLSELLSQHYSIGIAIGLIAGKPAGIVLFCAIAVKAGICKLPADLNWKIISGAGILGGIGFTMSIFITLLAFDDQQIIDHAKLVILLSSLIAGLTGYFFLNATLKKGSHETK